MKQLLSSALILIAATVVATGCGGPPTVGEVRDCLEQLDLEVDQPEQKDPDVKEFVIGTTDQSKGKEDFLMAVAATANSDSVVEKFRKDTADFAKQDLGAGDTKIAVESGEEGRYVWVVTGTKGSDQFDSAIECVQP